ncbi:beta-ketoacyl-[acyl-carrier-protein] synthase family protein [Pleionea sediminis]|uniref:beta-ketoacyl-[acyl-carrier-protein] synthase family protein n=1 Tax=Pleionea sediminis TaxID=2569479 RepID=UPI001184C15A|nr:beta-ketoacyl-[acyl-carrier-protein] synthase family protein [Pleionea sediminis]
MESIVIKDVGIICALGAGKVQVAERLFRGESPGITKEYGWLPNHSVPVGKVLEVLNDVPTNLSQYNCRNNRLITFAADEISDSVKDIKSRYPAERIGVVVGTSTSGILEGEDALGVKKDTGKFNSDYHYLQQEIGTPALYLQQFLGLEGVAYTISTACSSSGKVFAAARRLMSSGLCDAVIVGGSDSLCRLTINGFSSLESVSDDVCDPMGESRNGITIGEGAALFVLEKCNEADQKDILLFGIGESSDAHHMSAPDPTGDGAEAAMLDALEKSHLSAEDIKYVNLHGTATVKNDAMESLAVHRLFGDSVPCSSTKSLTGHCLGAAGAIEACILWLTLSDYNKENKLPPHIYSGKRDSTLPEIRLAEDLHYDVKDRNIFMSNSFAFGGSNVSLIIGR